MLNVGIVIVEWICSSGELDEARSAINCGKPDEKQGIYQAETRCWIGNYHHIDSYPRNYGLSIRTIRNNHNRCRLK